MPAKLVTIAPSHYCEKARWALDRAGWRWEEERHIPGPHMFVTFATSGQRRVPILVTPHGKLSDSTKILEFVDRSLDESVRLFPDDAALRQEVSALEEDFDKRLGPATRRLAYFHLMKREQLFVQTITAGMGSVPRKLAGVLRKPIAALIKRGLKIEPEAAARSKARIEEVFDAVDQKLADGRRFLAGDRFTAADLGFASLAAPAILPAEYGSWLPPMEEIPAEYNAIVTQWRERPAGKLVLRLFKEERRRVVAKQR